MAREEESAFFRISIREVVHGFAFPKLPILKLKIVDVQMDEPKTHIYIKSFTHLVVTN